MTPQQEIETYAIQKLKDWALDTKGWTFGWNTRRASFGVCRVRSKRIELSTFLFPIINKEERKDTVLHELAHALDAEERGYSNHDRNWKLKAIMVGAKPQRCKNLDQAEEKRATLKCKYTLICPNGHEFHRHRFMRRDTSCPTCNSSRYDERFKLPLRQNY